MLQVRFGIERKHARVKPKIETFDQSSDSREALVLLAHYRSVVGPEKHFLGEFLRCSRQGLDPALKEPHFAGLSLGKGGGGR